ncbi:hypothetical protein Tco_0280880 [Tanacetum coccineum]
MYENHIPVLHGLTSLSRSTEVEMRRCSISLYHCSTPIGITSYYYPSTSTSTSVRADIPEVARRLGRGLLLTLPDLGVRLEEVFCCAARDNQDPR